MNIVKKAVLLVIVWLLLLSGGAVAKNNDGIPYEIHFDSETQETYPLQEQLKKTYRDLMDGIQEESRYTVLVHNLSMFEETEDTLKIKADMKNGTLMIRVGDGKGCEVRGTLNDWNYCVAKVEPKSWLASLFS